MTGAAAIQLGARSVGAKSLLADLLRDQAASRLFAGDATLWGSEAEAEAAIRLGWIDAADRSAGLVADISALRHELLTAGVNRFVLCGMGGSSLAPEVIVARDRVELTVLDSTHPVTVGHVLSTDPTHTAVVVSSKSGSTIDTLSHLAAFEERFALAGVDSSSRIIIVTDPGSPLETHAHKRGYRVFLADPTVGGRFSALTAFGLVPAGLAGADIERLLAEARDATSLLATDASTNPAMLLAAAIVSGLPQRYTCALVELGSEIGLGDWIEQLVAESTGKHGKGVLPLVVPADAPELHGSLPAAATLIALDVLGADTDTQISAADITISAPLGAHFLLWEAATVLLCRLINVNPFDQPDVESAKIAARAILESSSQNSAASDKIMSSPVGNSKVIAASPPVTSHGAGDEHQVVSCPSGDAKEDCRTIADAVQQLKEALAPNGYLAIQIYADRQLNSVIGERLRESFARNWPVPVTLGWGPRFLHSTGQLHKGGPKIGAFFQIYEESIADVSIPDTELGFARLVEAQAQGDRDVLLARKRPVLAVSTANLPGLIQEIEHALRIE